MRIAGRISILLAMLMFFTSLARADEPTTAPSDPRQFSQTAKVQYETQLAEVKRAYLDAVVKADTTYIQNLETAVKQAMSNQDLRLAETLDVEHKKAMEKVAQDRALVSNISSASPAPPASGVDLKGYRLVKAAWVIRDDASNSPTDVTDKIKPILRENAGNVVANTELFGDQMPYRTKALVIDYLRPNGLSAQYIVNENTDIPKFDLPWDIPADQSASPNNEIMPTGSQPSDERSAFGSKLAGSRWRSGGYGLSYVFNQDSTVTRTDGATGFWFPISGNSVVMMDSHGYAGIVTFDEKLSTFNERFAHLDSTDQGNRE
jgi:hypothetical protein